MQHNVFAGILGIATAISVMAGSPRTALAQPSLTPAATAVVESGDSGPKRPAVATTIAIGGSLLVPAAIATLLIFDDGENRNGIQLGASIVGAAGPSAGALYAGDLRLAPLLIRSVGMGLVVSGVNYYSKKTEYVGCDGWSFGGHSVCTQEKKTVIDTDGTSLIIAGVATVMVGTFYDIIVAGDSARKYNRRHASHSLRVSPNVVTRQGVTTNTLVLGGTF